MKLIVIVLTLPLIAVPPTIAGQTAPSHNASCKINALPPTEADIAFYRHESAKAANLYADIGAKDPSDLLARARQIQSLLDGQKTAEAATLVEAWTPTPANAYAILAAGSVRLAQGDMLEGYALFAKAAALNPCIADVYVGLALYEELAGYHAAARKHLALGHQLDPVNDRLRYAWINSLPQSQQMDQMALYVADNKIIDDRRRDYLRARLARSKATIKADCHMVSAAKDVVIPMTRYVGDIGIDKFGLEVAFNGTTRVLRIDTTAGGIRLDTSVAAGLGLSIIDKPHLGLISEEQHSLKNSIEEAASVKIGGVEFANCPVEVFSYYGGAGTRPANGGEPAHVSSEISTNFFANYLVTLDYVHQKVHLERLPQRPDDTTPADHLDAMAAPLNPDTLAGDRYISPSMQSWTKIYRSSHSLLMPARIGSAGTKLFRIDSGLANSIISLEAAREVTKTSGGGTNFIGGVYDVARKESLTGKLTIDFAGLREPVRSMSAIDMSDFSASDGVGVSGFIGYSILEQLVLHIDYRDNLMFLEAPGAIKK